MNLTPRGLRFLLATVLLFALAITFADIFLLAASLAALFLLAFDMADAIRTSHMDEGVARLEPSRFHASLIRGDETTFKANLTATRHIAIGDSRNPWLQCEPSDVDAGDMPILMTIAPKFSGRYAIEHTVATARSRFGFYSVLVEPKLTLDVRVYPRFLVASLAVAELLIKGGAAVTGESETPIIGPGLEYAETRPYEPGDSLRRIDWKATARFSSLMVKQFYRDTGGGINLIYLLDAPGSRTHDEMATEFLNLVLSTSYSGMTVNVAAFTGDRVVARFSGRGQVALASALSLVLEKSGVSLDELYSVLDVAPLSQERKALLLAGKDAIADLIEKASGVVRIENSRAGYQIGELAEPDRSSTFVILSSLVSRSRLLPWIIDDLSARQCRTLLAYPRQPWNDALDLEEAYRMNLSLGKTLRYAESKSCTPVPLPLPASFLGASLTLPAQMIDRAS